MLQGEEKFWFFFLSLDFWNMWIFIWGGRGEGGEGDREEKYSFISSKRTGAGSCNKVQD